MLMEGSPARVHQTYIHKILFYMYMHVCMCCVWCGAQPFYATFLTYEPSIPVIRRLRLGASIIY